MRLLKLNGLALLLLSETTRRAQASFLEVEPSGLLAYCRAVRMKYSATRSGAITPS
jgi:hypothetical protein